jgi:MFS family permease
MDANVFLPAITAILAGVFFLALVDQWRTRRRAYQAIWAAGILFFGIAVACEAIAAAAGWNEPVYRLWYLTGAVWTAGWLGLGNAFLLGRTRFGFAFAVCLFFAGLFTFLTARRNPEIYSDASTVAMLYFLVAAVLALAVSIETYFQNWRWPWMALAAVGGATALSLVLMLLASLPAPGYSLDPETGVPTAEILPPELRLLTPFMNVTGAFALILGALFSAYVFMPKKRVLEYSLDPSQPGDQFMFNLLISPVAIVVNFVASLPGAVRTLLTGRINSRVPATLLIAIGAFIPAVTDSLNRFGSTEWFQLGKFFSVLFLLAGFLVSTETFSEIRVPFTHIVLRGRRSEAREATDS